MSKYSPFPAGTEVEVRSLEKGFHGAWFEATVEFFSRYRRRYTVTYASLVADDDPSAPLRDFVFLSNVRPRPPRPPRGAHFPLHRVVDAFHNDAWWKGVVSAVPNGEEGRYRVCFPYTREELEFDQGDVRDHVRLVRDRWVAVEAEGEHDVMFGVGTRVEVSRDKESFGSSWFCGTALKVIGKSYLLVEYDSLWVEDDGNKKTLLREIVGLPYIRPSPPLESKSFDVLDEVEAFHCGGWFSGIVLKILPGSRYIFQFKHRVEELELDHTALRSHSNWANGKWIHINQENCSRASALRGTKSAGSRRKSRSHKSPYFPPSVPTLKNNDREVHGGSVKLKVKKAEGPGLHSQVNLSQSHKNLKKRRSLEQSLMVDATSLDCDSQTTTVVRKLSSTAAPMLETNPIDQIKKPRGFRTPGGIKSSAAVAPMSGAATSKHQIMSSQPQKKLKTGDSLEKFVGSSSETATKVGENSVSEMPSPTLGNQHSNSSSPERTAASSKVGTNLLLISCNKSNKAADRSNVDLKDKKVERPNLGFLKSSEIRRMVKNGKLVKLKKRLVDGMPMDSGSKTPTILRKVSSSSVPILESPNLQGQIKLPHYRKFKEINTLVEDQLIDGTLMEHGSIGPTKAGKCSSATPLLKESPALMDGPQHLKIPSLVKIPAIPEVETSLPMKPSYGGLSHDQDISRVNATDESMISGEGYSNCRGTEEHQLKAANINRSLVNYETTNLISIPKANTKVQRKAHVVRTSRRHRKTLYTDVKQQPQDKVKKRGRGRLPWKRITDINGMEPKKMEERTEQDGKGEGKQPISDNSYRSSKLLDVVEDHSETPQIDSLEDARNVKYLTTQLPTIVGSKSFDVEVQGIRSCVNVLSGAGTQAETQALLSTSKEDSVYEKIDLAPIGSPFDKAAVEVERAPINPEPSRSSPSEEGDGRDNYRLTLSVPPVEKAIVIDFSLVDTRTSVQSLLKEVNVHNHNECNSVENTMVEMERASVNPTSKGLSSSKECDVCDHNEVMPSGSESVKATIEMEERAHISPVHGDPSNRIPLPFTKQSSMWDSVHLLDIYQTVPQQPHFRQLEQYNMEFREGIAIGLMVTFANLVAGIKKLRIVDSQVVFEEKLKVLVSLESNGFNVQFVRSCLEKLLEVRRSYNHLKEKKVDLEGKLVKKEDKNSQLDALICAHDKVIVDVEESLTNYRKKLSSLLMVRNNMDTEIVQLEMDLQAAEEAYRSAEDSFNNAVSAPW